MIQLIEHKGSSWHMIIHGIDCTFIPMNLYIGNDLYAVKPDCENGLRWRVNRKWVSFNQIKNVINQCKQVK